VRRELGRGSLYGRGLARQSGSAEPPVGLVRESVYGQRATAEDLERLDALTGRTLERLERGPGAPPADASEPAAPEAKPPATS
jgi:hypothetical protein